MRRAVSLTLALVLAYASIPVVSALARDRSMVNIMGLIFLINRS